MSKNREILVLLRKEIGNRKVMQRDVKQWGEVVDDAKKPYQSVYLKERGVWVVYRLPSKE